MMVPDIGQTILLSLNNGLMVVINFIPKFIAGTIILIIGIIIASILRQILVQFLRALRVEAFLRKYGVPEMREDFTWSNLLAEIVRWFIIVIFLIPTAEIWGLDQVGTVLNTFLLYLPNVFVAAIIGVVGLAVAKLAHDIVLASTRSISHDASRTMASVTRGAIVVFVILAVLNQLGVATDLIRILFTGFVAMVAIAGGIAFGLGGQNAARDLIDNVRKESTSAIQTQQVKKKTK